MIKKIALIFLSVIIMLIYNCEKNTSESVEELYSVEGIVEGNQGPIQGAKVVIDRKFNWTTDTKEDGSFKIENVTKGDHEILVAKDYDSSFVERSYIISVETDLILNTMRLPTPLTLSNTEIKQTLTSNLIFLMWSKSDADDFREYKLYRHTTSGIDETTGELIHISTVKNDTIFTDSIPHSSTYYYRLYQMNEYGRLGGSNIVKVSSAAYTNEPLLMLEEINVRYLNKAETIWLYFPAVKGEVYKITWDHIEWGREFTASVSCYRENKIDDYFENEIVIPHTGSPKTIIAEEDEAVYIKVKGQTTNMEGVFRILIEHLSYGNSQNILLNGTINVPIDVGETRLYYFNAIADTQYQIYLNSEKNSEIIYVKVTVFREKMNYTYFYEELTGASQDPKNLIFTSLATELIHIIFTGGYYFKEALINVHINSIK
jgi:hypothetical protein